MKKSHLFPALIGLFLTVSTIQGTAQNTACTQCEGSTVTGTNASAVGKNNTASGNNALAGGYNSEASGSNSLAFGYASKATQSTNIALGNTAQATGIRAIAIGTYVKANAQNSYVFGAGTTASYPLSNDTPNSIAFGVNSNKPTMLITTALNNNYTGKVAIGKITNPKAKLHIKSDSNEDAGIIIEPSDKVNKKAFINLFDTDHSLTVDRTGALSINSGNGTVSLCGASYTLGRGYEPKTRFYNSNPRGIYFNAYRVKDTEFRDADAPSYAIDFNENDLCIRAAQNQPQRGSAISNWKETLFLCTDGKIGIGSKATFMENKNDETLILHSPSQLEFSSSNITLTGKIGINTTNTVEGYALAVNGGIISSKVYIKEVAQWPDYVFSKDYPLMSLEELGRYLDENRHLPGIPSETEIVDEGYDLHAMQCLMMEKIEEMTRYILVLQEEIDSLKATPKSNVKVQFGYDGCGNRISRSLVIEKMSRQEQESCHTGVLPYRVFPNPTNGSFTVLLEEPEKGVYPKATLVSTNGIVIEEREIRESQAIFDLSGHANGVYLLEIATQEGTQTWKIIKQ